MAAPIVRPQRWLSDRMLAGRRVTGAGRVFDGQVLLLGDSPASLSGGGCGRDFTLSVADLETGSLAWTTFQWSTT